MKKIYLAAPYSDKDKKVMQERFEIVTKKVGELMNQGHLVICPVTHYHPVAEMCELPRDWEYWKKIDMPIVEWVDEVWVLMIKGWKKSIGTQAEIQYARKLGKPVRYLTNRENEK